MSATLAWTAEAVAAVPWGDPAFAAPVFGAADAPRLLPGLDLWDLWPVRTPTGAVAAVAGRELWMGLSAPAEGDPGARHHIARIRLLSRGTDGARDLGPVFPDGASAGSREWAGCARWDADAGTLRVLYTAAGRRGETEPTFEQRLFEATAQATPTADGGLALAGWSDHVELVAADGAVYQPADEAAGVPGFIKAFRDPFLLTADGVEHLLFTGSVAGGGDFNGAVGHAVRGADGWSLAAPLVTAVAVNNELERPHALQHDGRWYLFISTQRRTFAPGVTGPTGLYGFVADALAGPYRPLNGSGLVLRNPDAEPGQAYSWMVLPDRSVTSFVDMHSLGGRPVTDVEAEGPDAARRHFGGTAAPLLHLELVGDATRLVP